MAIGPEQQLRLLLGIVLFGLFGELVDEHLRQALGVYIDVDDKVVLVFDVSDVLQILTMQLNQTKPQKCRHIEPHLPTLLVMFKHHLMQRVLIGGIQQYMLEVQILQLIGTQDAVVHN